MKSTKLKTNVYKTTCATARGAANKGDKQMIIDRKVFETIITAHVKKSEQMRKKLMQTLLSWQELTKDVDNKFERRIKVATSSEYTNFYIVPGDGDLLRYYRDGEKEWLDIRHIENESVVSDDTIIRIIEGIEPKIKWFFMKYQNEINELSDAYQKISRINVKLSEI